MPNLYATFKDPEIAVIFAKELRDGGYLMDDLSLLVHATYASTHPTSPHNHLNQLEDATAFVGRTDDPEGRPLYNMEKSPIPEDYFRESQVGGGIATDRPDDDISAIEEADDSEDLAEDETSWSRTEEVRDALDFGRLVITGFPTDVPLIDDFHQQPSASENIDNLLEAMEVPGFGVVMGGGGLATAALAQGREIHGHKPVLDYLQEEGVDPVAAMDMIKTFEDGGAVVEVSIGNGSVSQLEDFAEQLGAISTSTVSLPSY